MTKEFIKDLENLINRHGLDNKLGTPDFIIAEAIVTHIETLNALTEQRERWFGRVPPQETLSEKLGLNRKLGE